jgi:hypothetical protein
LELPGATTSIHISPWSGKNEQVFVRQMQIKPINIMLQVGDPDNLETDCGENRNKIMGIKTSRIVVVTINLGELHAFIS